MDAPNAQDSPGHTERHDDPVSSCKIAVAKDSGWWATLLSIIAIIISLSSAYFTCRQVDVASDTAHKQLRAYLLVKNVRIGSPIVAGEPLRVDATVVNYGQTPAFNLSYCMPPVLESSLPQHAPDYFSGGDFESWTVGPGDDVTVSFPLSGVMGPGYVKNINSGDKKLFIFVLLRYTDVYETPCSTQVCAEYLPAGGRTVSTEKHNYAR